MSATPLTQSEHITKTPLKSGHTVIIAGGSGFIGTSLARFLTQRGLNVVILSRSVPNSPNEYQHVRWDGCSQGDWTATLIDADAVINLAGRSVDCVKTPANADEILRSRVMATRTLGLAIRSVQSPPKVWVQMSTAHIYGDPATTHCSEDSPTGFGLAPYVGRAWEEEFEKQLAALRLTRGVVLRTGFVLGHDLGNGGGALSRLTFLSRLGIGGTIGTGRQGMSWIHEHDMNRIFDLALSDPEMTGIYNASSPNPVCNQDFMHSLRRYAGGLGSLRIGLPAPEWIVRLGARLALKTDPELAIYGRYVLPTRLFSKGFEFEFPTLDQAFAELFAGRSDIRSASIPASHICRSNKPH